MIKHITKKILFASIVTSVCVISSTQTLGCCWLCSDDEEGSKGQRHKLLESQQKGDDTKPPLQNSLMQQPDIQSQLPPTSASTSFMSSSESTQASVKQLIADSQYPVDDTFMDFLDKEEWLDQQVYEAISNPQFKNATNFKITPTKFKAYKLTITTGDDQEVKVIRQLKY